MEKLAGGGGSWFFFKGTYYELCMHRLDKHHIRIGSQFSTLKNKNYDRKILPGDILVSSIARCGKEL